MANALMHRIEVLDVARCGSAAEIVAAIEQMGISLDLAAEVRIELIEGNPVGWIKSSKHSLRSRMA